MTNCVVLPQFFDSSFEWMTTGSPLLSRSSHISFFVGEAWLDLRNGRETRGGEETGIRVSKGEPTEEGIEEEKPEIESVKPRNIGCENVVASVSFRNTEFNLEDLAEALDAEYKPSGFPGVSYSLEGTEATFLIFKSGKANCVGTTTPDEAREAPKLLAEKLADEGLEVDSDPKVEIQNLVVRADFGAVIDLSKLHSSPPARATLVSVSRKKFEVPPFYGGA